MTNFIVDFICILAHHPNLNYTSINNLRFQIIVVALQILALMFQNEDWWQNLNDPIFLYFRTILSYLLITPLIKIEILEDILLIICIIIQFASIFGILILAYLKISTFTDQEITTGYSNLFFKLNHHFILQIRYTVMIPLFQIYMKALICFQSSFCNNHPQNYVALLSLIILILQSVISIYFFRSYQLKPPNLLQQKYSTYQLAILALKIANIFIFQQEQSQFIDYLKVILFTFYLIVQLFEAYYIAPYTKDVNRLHFILYVIIMGMAIIIFIYVLSDKNVISQTFIFPAILLSIPLSFSLGYEIYENKSFENQIEQQLNQYQVVQYVQQIYENYKEIKNRGQHPQYFNYQKLINIHIHYCQGYCKRLNLNTSINSYIVCILQNFLRSAKIRNDVDYEQVQLLYINYLSHISKKPLLAYVELKKYEIYSTSKSYYFSQMQIQMNQVLQTMIRKQQQIQLVGQRDSLKKSLEIEQISKTILFEQRYIPHIVTLLEEKILFWQAQIKGFNSIYDLQRMAVILSEKVQILQKELESHLQFDVQNIDHLNQNKNVLELKLASIYYSTILNDYFNCNQCEQLILEIFNIEHTLSTELVTNLTLVEDKVALIMISMVKSRGQIINSDKRAMAQYFGYDDRDFQQIALISQLMPPYVSQIHDNLLMNYLSKSKSKLLEQYIQVFTSNQLGFLVSQQLKIDNNFLKMDDYVLMGCLSQVKQGSEHILFRDDGQIMGCTQQFFMDHIYAHDDKFSLVKFHSQAYIFMFFPNIVKILEGYKQSFGLNGNEQISIEDSSQMFIWKNLREIINLYQNMQQTQKSIRNDEDLQQKLKDPSYVEDQSQFAFSNITIMTSRKSKNIQNQYMLDNVKLFNKEYQTHISQFLDKLNDSQANRYYVKYNLSFNMIGQDSFKRQYFILEIVDIRKKDIMNASSQNPSKDQFNLDSKVFSLENNLDLNFSTLSKFSEIEVPCQEVVPDKEIGSGIAELLKKFGAKQINQKHQIGDGEYNLESGRDSLSYGPLSQRANFISMNQKEQVQDEMQKIDQDFNEIRNQLNSVSAIIQKDEEDIEDIDVDDSNNRRNQKEKSSSGKAKDSSSKILKIIRINKTKANLNHEDEEIEAIKSKSSRTSLTSGTAAMHIIKKFQSITHLTQSLRILSFISLFLFVILICLVAIHLIIITQSHNETISTISDINGPYLFNRNFLEVISFSWSLVFNSLGIVSASDFIIAQTMSDLTNTTLSLFDELDTLYPSFLNVEQQGLLSLQDFTLLNGTTEQSGFTSYLQKIKNTLAQVVKITQVNQEDLKSFITKEYLDQLLIMRINLKDLYDMASELIDSLNIIFLDQSTSRVTQMEIQIICEIICIGIILTIQLYFWRNIENYTQQILLLTGRLQESDATELIARSIYIKEILQQQSGKYSWKKQNYYSLNYNQINTLGLESFYSQSKFLRDFTSKQKKQINQEQEDLQSSRQGQKRNLNVVLNSRIYKTQISIVVPILFLILIFIILALFYLGGYLLFSQQAIDLIPSQTLTANYIKFVAKLDTMISCSLIIKTQNLLFQSTVESGLYQTSTLNSYKKSNDIIILLKELSEVYAVNMSSIYEDITQSKKIEDSDKVQLYELYENDFCEQLSDEIPMCNFAEWGMEKFTETFQKPDVLLDDNLEYLKHGIIGVISNLNTFFKQFYDYEMSTLTFQPDLTLALQQVNQKEFRNALFAHFLDTNDGTNTFLAIIQDSTNKILQSNLSNLYLYYAITGSGVILFFSVFLICWIYRTNKKLIRTRMSLINLPIDIITEQHTLSMLKKLN